MKRAIDGLVLALGLLLAATGLWWMWTGWDVVQVERGWVAVISGSVMLSGGVVLVGMVWAVSRLGALALAGSAVSSTAPVIFPADPAASIEPAPPPIVSTAHSFNAGPLVLGGAAAAATLGAASTSGESRRDNHDDASEPVVVPVDVSNDRLGEDERDEPVAQRPTFADLMRRISPLPIPSLGSKAAPRSDEPALHEAVDEFLDEEEDDVSEIGDIDEEETVQEEKLTVGPAPVVDDTSLPSAGPIFPHPRISIDVEPPVFVPADLDPPDDEGDWFDQAERSLGRAPRASEPESAGSAPEPEVPKKPPAITGRYSSGDTNYIMFDDGSIEAHTPDGVMRFASLVELRRFVEQRQ